MRTWWNHLGRLGKLYTVLLAHAFFISLAASVLLFYCGADAIYARWGDFYESSVYQLQNGLHWLYPGVEVRYPVPDDAAAILQQPVPEKTHILRSDIAADPLGQLIANDLFERLSHTLSPDYETAYSVRQYHEQTDTFVTIWRSHVLLPTDFSARQEEAMPPYRIVLDHYSPEQLWRLRDVCKNAQDANPIPVTATGSPSGLFFFPTQISVGELSLTLSEGEPGNQTISGVIAPYSRWPDYFRNRDSLTRYADLVNRLYAASPAGDHDALLAGPLQPSVYGGERVLLGAAPSVRLYFLTACHPVHAALRTPKLWTLALLIFFFLHLSALLLARLLFRLWQSSR